MSYRPWPRPWIKNHDPYDPVGPLTSGRSYLPVKDLVRALGSDPLSDHLNTMQRVVENTGLRLLGRKLTEAEIDLCVGAFVASHHQVNRRLSEAAIGDTPPDPPQPSGDGASYVATIRNLPGDRRRFSWCPHCRNDVPHDYHLANFQPDTSQELTDIHPD